VLWDKVLRRDVLWRAWVAVRRNNGAPGIDHTTLADVEEYGVARFLDELAADLRDGSYRPLPARRVFIVRRVAPRRIPCSAGRNSEGGSWVYRLTRCRKADGTRACRMAVAR
jgi:retron-type reverse transcriptase